MTVYEAKVLAHLEHQSECLSLIAQSLRGKLMGRDLDIVANRVLERELQVSLDSIDSAAAAGFYEK